MSSAPALRPGRFLNEALAEEAARYIEQCLAVRRSDPGPLVVVLPAPRLPVATAARVLPSGGGACWVSRNAALEISAATAGRAVRLVPGDGGIAALADRTDALWRTLAIEHHPLAAEFSPFLIGGLAFAPGASRGPWSPFGDGYFDLPRWSYVPGALALTFAGADERQQPRYWADAFRAIAARHLPASSIGGPPPRIVAREGLTRDDWGTLVREIRAAIGRGEVNKIVLARREAVTAGSPLEPLEVFDRLDREDDDGPSFRFCFREESVSFVGCSPEPLLEIEGLRFATEAVAGSRDASSRLAEPLLESAKDRDEHAIVVDAIRSRLGPLCAELSIDPKPAVRRLAHVSHLVTAIHGRLDRPMPPLTLVGRLHPTPSVGGDPSAAALSFLEGHEPSPRGWYAAPVGILDAAGRAQFAVAIRSALLEENRAHLFAGAGIVAASDPDAEFEETALKLRTLLDALGLFPLP